MDLKTLLETIDRDKYKQLVYLYMERSCGKTWLRNQLLKKLRYDLYMREQCKTAGSYAVRFVTPDLIGRYKNE